MIFFAFDWWMLQKATEIFQRSFWLSRGKPHPSVLLIISKVKGVLGHVLLLTTKAFKIPPTHCEMFLARIMFKLPELEAIS